MEARIVIMDEPTSALSLHEVEDLYAIIRRLRDAGKAIVFISHKFEDIYEIAGPIHRAPRRADSSGEGSVAETKVDEIIRLMIGRSLTQMFPKVDVQPGEILLSVQGLSRTGVFKDVSFELRRGEILGFFGLVGAGRSEVMRAVFGIEAAGCRQDPRGRPRNDGLGSRTGHCTGHRLRSRGPAAAGHHPCHEHPGERNPADRGSARHADRFSTAAVRRPSRTNTAAAWRSRPQAGSRR